LKSARTKDEQFIECLHDEALKQEDMDAVFEVNYIGKKISILPTAAKTICVLLAQSNFIKKRGDGEISITSNGIDLVKRIRERDKS
jgi:hypothetical protein